MKQAFESLMFMIAVGLVVFIIAGTSGLSSDAQAVLMTLALIGIFTAPVISLAIIAWAMSRSQESQPPSMPPPQRYYPQQYDPYQLPYPNRQALPPGDDRRVIVGEYTEPDWAEAYHYANHDKRRR